jgi:hypothetical protein
MVAFPLQSKEVFPVDEVVKTWDVLSTAASPLQKQISYSKIRKSLIQEARIYNQKNESLSVVDVSRKG